ncbi:extracellular solute-binding protein [bacterium]|nr:extracellular solute-binding protein [bacterium]
MNKRMLIIVGGGTLAVLFVGLIAFAGGCFRKKEYKVATSNKIVELTYYKLFDDSDVIEPIIQEYRAIHPNVKINYRQFTDSDEYYDLILNELAEGEGPDIFSVPNTWFVKNYKKVYPAPANMLPPKIFEDTFVSVTTDDLVKQNPDTGEILVYGIPMTVDTLALYYNKDQFDDALPAQGKPSVTWDGIKEDVFKLTKKDNSFERFEVSGMAMGFANNISRAVDILYLLMLQDGGRIYDQNYAEAIFAQQQGVDSDGSIIKPGPNALKLYTSFADPVNKNYSWNAYLSDASSAEKEIATFARGKVSMIIGYSYMYNQILNEIKQLQAKGLSTINPDVIRIAMIPQKKDPAQSTEKRIAYAHYFAETVARTSENPRWAWDFLMFETSKESLQHYNEKTHKPTSRRDLIEEQKADPIYGVFADQIGIAESFPIYNDKAYEKIFLKAIESVLATKSPADAMKIAQDEINAMLPSGGLIPQVTATDEEKANSKKST